MTEIYHNKFYLHKENKTYLCSHLEQILHTER